MSVQVERRRHPRVRLAGKKVVVRSDVSQGEPGIVCELHDVSVGGLRCASARTLPVDGGEVVIEFPVLALWRHHVLRLPARAVRSGPEPSMYAFELTAVTDSAEARRFEGFVRRAAVASHKLLEERRGLDRQVEEALEMVQLGLPRHDGARPRVVMLTSPMPGPTGFLTAGLAVVLARQGDSVLAVDVDLGNPKLHRLLGVGMSPGVADWLEAPGLEIAALTQLGSGGVRVLPAGDASPSRVSCGRAAIALLIERLRHSGAWYVLINAPACLVAADAGLLSELADDVFLVLRSEGSSEAEVAESGALLRRHDAHVRGAILTDSQVAPDWSGLSGFLGSITRPFARARRAIAASRARSTIARRVETPGTVALGESGIDHSR